MTRVAPSPAVAVVVRPGWFVVRVDVTGLPPDTLHVDLSEDVLIIRGEDCPGRCESFSRAIDLPSGAWPDRARVMLADGLLDIRVPVPFAIHHV